MMQFGDLPTGGYFWRPPYINHGAFRSELGVLAFGLICGLFTAAIFAARHGAGRELAGESEVS